MFFYAIMSWIEMNHTFVRSYVDFSSPLFAFPFAMWYFVYIKI